MLLTTKPFDPVLDLADYVGQRAATFRFELVDAITGYRRVIKPRSDSAPTLTHNTRNTIKRGITGLYLDRADTAAFNSISSRLEVIMIIRGVEYPLGHYVPASWLRFRLSPDLDITSVATFYDEGVIVDQQLDTSFGPTSVYSEVVSAMLTRLLTPLPITFTLEPTEYVSVNASGIGSRRGFVVEQLALDGDYLSPWFDNTGVMRFIRNFDPATAIPTFNLDEGHRVLRDNIIESDDLIDAPNRFIVVGNGVDLADSLTSIVGVYDVPSSAPNSIANRGFVIPEVTNRQVTTSTQANAVAANLAQRQVIAEQVELATVPDPRHDSYDVLRWQGENWLETQWSLSLVEGGQMHHTARKAYRP